MLTVSTWFLVWKLLQSSRSEYIQSTLISACNELCRYASQIWDTGAEGRYCIPNGLSAAAVWLTAIARNLKVTVSCLSDSGYPMGFWLLRKTGLPIALLLFRSTTFIAQFKRTLYSWGCCGRGIVCMHVSKADVNPRRFSESFIAPDWCIRLDWLRIFRFAVKRSRNNEWIMK